MSPNYKNKRVLITGGLGFIGSNLAIRLVESGAIVTIVDSLIPEYGGNLFNVNDINGDIKINISDVRDEYSLKFLVQDQEIMFNLAGQTSHMDSMINPMTDLEINAKAQLSILECCKKNNPTIKIVYASTRQIYGKPEYLPVDENHPIRPVDVNGINKMAGEWYHLLYNNVYGIQTSVIRLTNTYGPRMRVKDARQTFLGIWIKNIVQNSHFEVWGGEQLRDYNYIDDVVDAFLMIGLESGSNGKVYNLGSHEVLSLFETASIMKEVNDKAIFEIKSFPEERKRIDIGDYYTDFSKINNELKWVPKVSFKEGMKRTLSFYEINLDKYL